MISFGMIRIEGFLSILGYEFNLSSKGTNIFRGRNGSGKSTFLSAISWVLYGSITKEDVKDVNTWQRHRPKDYKGTMVSIFFERDNVNHQVIRCSNYKADVRGAKGKDRLIYIIDGEEVLNKRKQEIQAMICEDLGMSHELFLNSVMFGQGLKRLVQEKSSDKKDLFEELFDISYISIARDLASSKLKSLIKDIGDIEAKVLSLTSQRDVLVRASADIKKSAETFNISIQEDISNYKSKINSLKEKVDWALAQYKPELISKYEARLAKYQEQKKQLGEILKKNQELVSKLSTKKGLHTFIDEMLGYLTKGNWGKLREGLIKLRDALVSLSEHREKLDEIAYKVEELREKILEMGAIHDTITNNQERIKSYQDLIARAKSKKIPEEPKKNYSRDINRLNLEIGKLQPELEQLSKLKDDYKWLMDMPLGNKGIKSYIFESSLQLLNDTLRSYSSLIGMNIEFSIDLNSTKRDFYTLIEFNGVIASYGELSGGQKQLVHVAMAFAMHTATTSYRGINILFLDEVFENLDSDNIEIIIQLIRRVSEGKSIYIITHQPSLPIGNSRVINVELVNGITRIS